MKLQNILSTGALVTSTLVTSVSTTIAQVPVVPSRVPHWEQLGPMPGAGPEVIRLVDTAADPDRLYAASRAGTLASFDRGLTWELRSRYTESYAGWGFLAASPTDADTLIRTSFFGRVERSVDGGQTWTEPTVPPGGPQARAPQFSGSGTVYISSFHGIWRSLDGGDTFEEILGDLLGGYCIYMGIDASDPLHLYAPVSGVGLFETTDGGASWVVKPLPDPQTLLSFAVDPLDANRLLTGSGGIHLSTDAGATWFDITPSWSVWPDSLAFDPVDPMRFYAGFRGEGFAVTDDGGASWTVVADPGLDTSGWNPFTILPSTVHTGQIVVGQPGGLFRSTDSGTTFQRVNSGLQDYATVRALTVDPFDPTHLVAITGGSAYVSHTGGMTWTEATGFAGMLTYDAAADQAVPGRFYVGDWGGGFWRSDDGGHTYYESHPGAPYFVHLAAHPTVGGRVYGAGSGLQRSDDGGLTFTKTSAPIGWSWATAISPADPNVMYVTGSSKVLHSVDGGITWQDATTKPAGIVRDLYADPLDANVAYAAASGGGLYRTDDHGVNWTPMSADFKWANTVTVPDFNRGLTITNDLIGETVHISRNGGVTSNAIGRGLVTSVLDFANAPTKLFAGTAGQGVVILRD